MYFQYIQTERHLDRKLINIVNNRQHRRVSLNSIPLCDTYHQIKNIVFVLTLRVMLYSVTAVLCIKTFSTTRNFGYS